MSHLFTVWDANGEPFEVSDRRRTALLAKGWTVNQPKPKAPKVKYSAPVKKDDDRDD